MTEKVIKWNESVFLEKIKPIITKERVATYVDVVDFFSRYMTEKEKQMKKIYLRTLKLKLDTYEKFS